MTTAKVKEKCGMFSNRVLAVLVAACLVIAGAAPAMATGIPVIDIIQDVQQVLNWIEMYWTKYYSYYQLAKQLFEGEYFSVLFQMLDKLEEYQPETEVGEGWRAAVLDIRDLYNGTAGTYLRAKDLMGRIVGDIDDLAEVMECEDCTNRDELIDYVDASSLNAIKQVGRYRKWRDKRNERAEELIDKANGETGQDKLLQMVVESNAHLLKGQNDTGLLLTNIAEMESVQLQLQHERLYREELSRQLCTTAMLELTESMTETSLPKIEIPQ